MHKAMKKGGPGDQNGRMRHSKTIPKFSCVEDGLISVEDWCASALRLVSQFAGSEAMKIRAIRDVIPLPELKARDVDLTKFTVLTFLSQVINDMVGDTRIKAVLVRPRNQPWVEFRRQLITWASTHGTQVSDGWLLAQMRANTQMHRDALGATPVSSEAWARIMDRMESMYNHASQDVQPSSSVASIESEEESDVPVDAVHKGKRFRVKKHRVAKESQKLCYKCGRPGHFRRDCWKYNNGQNKLVYSIAEDECVPHVGLWSYGKRHGRKNVATDQSQHIVKTFPQETYRR